MNLPCAALMLLASNVVYVNGAELAHHSEPNPSPEFWLRLGRTLPKYERRQAWLVKHGIEVPR